MVVFVWWCLCGGVFVFLWRCFHGGVFAGKQSCGELLCRSVVERCCREML